MVTLKQHKTTHFEVDRQSILLLNRKRVYELFEIFITFHVRRSRGEMHIGHGRLCLCVCLCVSLSLRIPTLLHRPGCKSEELYRGAF